MRMLKIYLVIATVMNFYCARALAQASLNISVTSSSKDPEAVVQLSEKLVATHAESFFSYFNPILKDLNLPLIQNLSIKLNYNPHPTSIPGAQASKTDLVFNYSQTPIDLTLLTHELGHVLHANIGPPESEMLFDKEEQGSAIVEGIANILAVLYLQSPFIACAEYLEAGFNINSFVSWSNHCSSADCREAKDLTHRYWFEKLLASPNYRSRFPEAVLELQKELASSKTSAVLNGLNPYLVSASVNQPLWIVANRYGFETVIRLVLVTISKLKDFRKFENFAVALLTTAKDMKLDANLITDLKSELINRGFIL